MVTVMVVWPWRSGVKNLEGEGEGEERLPRVSKLCCRVRVRRRLFRVGFGSGVEYGSLDCFV